MKRNILLFLLAVSIFSCKEQPAFDPKWTAEKAPAVFTARFETTKGDFDIEVTRSWSPHAADRLYQLIRHGYYDNAIFYRVVPDFVAQFGNTDVPTMNQWKAITIPDEPVTHSNKRGTVSFARYGPHSRDLEVFINLKDNTVLDSMDFQHVKGFTPVGVVKQNMEVVDQLYSGYGETTMRDDNLYDNRELFYQTYPKLDLIKKAYVVE